MKKTLNKILQFVLVVLFLIITGISVYYVIYILDFYTSEGEGKLKQGMENKSTSSGSMTNTQTSSGEINLEL